MITLLGLKEKHPGFSITTNRVGYMDTMLEAKYNVDGKEHYYRMQGVKRDFLGEVDKDLTEIETICAKENRIITPVQKEKSETI